MLHAFCDSPKIEKVMRVVDLEKSLERVKLSEESRVIA
jgi:hypothetical protein